LGNFFPDIGKNFAFIEGITNHLPGTKVEHHLRGSNKGISNLQMSLEFLKM
jgi:hypothetical protein